MFLMLSPAKSTLSKKDKKKKKNSEKEQQVPTSSVVSWLQDTSELTGGAHSDQGD